MFTQLTTSTKAFLFFAIAFGLTLMVSLLAPLLGDATLIVHMFTPLLATLLLLLVVTRDGYTKAGWAALGLHRAGLRAWGLALLLPFLILGFGYSVVWLTGIASFAVPAGGVPATLPLQLVVGIVMSSLLAFGEQIGFRGYLLPQLSALGPTRALLLSGLLHAIWHLPVLLLTPYYHSEGNLLIVVPLFLATLTLAGVFYGYLRLTTDSAWPSTLAHGAFNSFWDTFTVFTVTASPLALEYLAGATGVLPLTATAIVAGWVLYRLNRRTRSVRATAAQTA
jgi:membrane protease YdiL (CAAX protease family)